MMRAAPNLIFILLVADGLYDEHLTDHSPINKLHTAVWLESTETFNVGVVRGTLVIRCNKINFVVQAAN